MSNDQPFFPEYAFERPLGMLAPGKKFLATLKGGFKVILTAKSMDGATDFLEERNIKTLSIEPFLKR